VLKVRAVDFCKSIKITRTYCARFSATPWYKVLHRATRECSAQLAAYSSHQTGFEITPHSRDSKFGNSYIMLLIIRAVREFRGGSGASGELLGQLWPQRQWKSETVPVFIHFQLPNSDPSSFTSIHRRLQSCTSGSTLQSHCTTKSFAASHVTPSHPMLLLTFGKSAMSIHKPTAPKPPRAVEQLINIYMSGGGMCWDPPHEHPTGFCSLFEAVRSWAER